MKHYGKVEIVGVFLGEHVDVGEIRTSTKLARGEAVRPSTLTELVDFGDDCKSDFIKDNGEI